MVSSQRLTPSRSKHEMTHIVTTIVENNAYDMILYMWVLKLKTWDHTQKGGLVCFAAPMADSVVNGIYPLAAKRKFAFCPIENWNEFNNIRTNLNEIPSYIVFFDEHDILSLELFRS